MAVSFHRPTGRMRDNGWMVIPTGIEPVTYRLGICRSILLSYGTNRCAFAGDSGIAKAFRHILFFMPVANPAKAGRADLFRFRRQAPFPPEPRNSSRHKEWHRH